MNGSQHAITTLFITIFLLRIYGGYMPDTAKLLLVFGAFISSHTATIWGIPSFSPDMDLMIGRLLSVNIHRKWYFHSYLLMIPIVWAANYFLTRSYNVEVGSLLLGVNLGWNAHIIEDWLWSSVKNNRRYFSDWVIATSLLGVITSLFGLGLAKPEYFSDYLMVYNVLYYTVYFGFIPVVLGFFVG